MVVVVVVVVAVVVVVVVVVRHHRLRTPASLARKGQWVDSWKSRQYWRPRHGISPNNWGSIGIMEKKMETIGIIGLYGVV